jgi:hypothetical protein
MQKFQTAKLGIPDPVLEAKLAVTPRKVGRMDPNVRYKCKEVRYQQARSEVD